MILSVTGHRPDKLGGYNNDTSIKLEGIAVRWLRDNHELLGIETVITGMALGWDTAVARACIALHIPFIAAVPFKGQELMWPEPRQAFYRYLLEQAKEIVIVSKGKYSSKKMQIRNEWMVDNSDQLLAMWDGSPGGTNNCVQYALKQDKEIINLYDQFKYPKL